jgi:hypothetical protein
LFFSAFLGVSQQGEFENKRKKIEYVSKKITGEIFFRVALVQRLSVRGTQKRDKKFYGVVRLIFFPLTDFFLGRFWAFLDEGNSKTRLKK